MLERSGTVHVYPGLEQLMCAALADPALATQLLRDPDATLRAIAPTIQLTPAERALAVAVRDAVDIHDYAAQLHSRVQQTQSRSV